MERSAPSLQGPTRWRCASAAPNSRAAYGNRTYYVRTMGAICNDGLTDDAAGAFLTNTKAVQRSRRSISNGFNVTVNVAEERTLRIDCGGQCTALVRVRWSSSADVTTPSNVTLNITGDAISCSGRSEVVP
jgi:hypothetical protein